MVEKQGYRDQKGRYVMKDLNKKYNIAVRSKIELPEEERQRLIKQWKNCPTSSGRTQYLRHLNGVELTYREMCLAMCAECSTGYIDGRQECKVPKCPLYPVMPYRGK